MLAHTRCVGRVLCHPVHRLAPRCNVFYSTLWHKNYSTDYKARSRRDGSRLNAKSQKIKEDVENVEVPAVGWMWMSGTSQSGTSGPPTAMSTVANLKQDRIKAKKSLGQNFLTDDTILRNIVMAARVKAGDVVMEIGPGTGNLTKHLLQSGALVTAVEKDDTLYARLTEEYKEERHLRLLNQDVLSADLPELLQGMMDHASSLDLSTPPSGASADEHSASIPPPAATANAPTAAATPTPASPSQPQQEQRHRRIKVVANLPYNITKDFLKLMLPLGEQVSELSIMIQEEAAVRLVHAKPGDSDFRAMNARVLFYSKPKYRFRISKTKYHPEPGVDGALVTFELLPPTARVKVDNEHTLLALVEKAFSSRRKKLRNSLESLYNAKHVEAALQASGLPPACRAQDLSLDHWAALYTELQRS